VFKNLFWPWLSPKYLRGPNSPSPRFYPGVFPGIFPQPRFLKKLPKVWPLWKPPFKDLPKLFGPPRKNVPLKRAKGCAKIFPESEKKGKGNPFFLEKMGVPKKVLFGGKPHAFFGPKNRPLKSAFSDTLSAPFP